MSNNCLMCLSSVDTDLKLTRPLLPEPCDLSSTLISQELDVFFVLRNILNVPKPLCEEFLIKGGSPSNWGINLCSCCNLIVRETQFIFSRVKGLIKEYEGLKETFRGRFVAEGSSSSKHNLNEEVSSRVRLYLQDLSTTKLSSKEEVISPQRNVPKPGKKKKRGRPPKRLQETTLEEASLQSLVDEEEETICIKDVQTLQNFNETLVKIEPDDEEDTFLHDPLENLDEIIPEDEGTNDSETFGEDTSPRKSLRPRKTQNFKKGDDEESSEEDSRRPNDDAEEMDDWCPSDEEEETFKNEGDDAREPNYGRKIRQSDQKKDRARFKNMEGEEGGSSKRKKRLHQCPFCSSSLQSALICEAHILRVHKGFKKAFPCDLCPKAFGEFATVLSHIDYNHQSEIKSTPLPPPTDSDTNEEKKLLTDEQLFNYIFQVREVEEEESNDAVVEPLKPQKTRPSDNVFNYPLHCHLCNSNFSVPWLLKGHILRCHYGDRQSYECDLCIRRFERHVTMTEHRERYHPDAPSYQGSDRTSMEARIEELSNNQKSSHNIIAYPKKTYHCNLCDLTFNNRCVSEVHLKRVHEDSSTKLQCPHCDFKFLTEIGRRSHINRQHTQNLKRPRSNSKTYNCKECNLTWKSEQRMLQHFRKLHGGMKTHLCEFCSVALSSFRNLGMHQRQMHYQELGIDPIKCPKCGKAFNNERKMRNHLITAHTKKFQHNCSQCKRGFADKYLLLRHIKVIHENQKKYKCDVCNKEFSHVGNLRVHVRIHTGERPYKCKSCPKEFADKPTFNRHVQTHGTHVHVCPTCQKEFKVWHAFRLHCKLHDGTLPKRKKAEKLKKGNRYILYDQEEEASSSNSMPDSVPEENGEMIIDQ